MRRALAAAAALALALPALAAAKPAPPPGPVLVRTSFSPPAAFFGDHLTARVDVTVDRTRVDDRTLELDVAFGHLEQIGPARTVEQRTATRLHRSETFTVACISMDCLPKGPILQPIHVPPLVVTARTLDGGTLTLHLPWKLQLAGRFLPPATGDSKPLLQGNTLAPAPTYAVDPSAWALALDVVGALALAAALALAGLQLVPWWLARRRGQDTRPPLVRALQLAREAQGRDAADRRRAAGLLARLLRDDEAAEVAWSRPDPSPAELEQLAARAEREGS